MATCSKCRAADAKKGQRWCLPCIAAYNRVYRGIVTKLVMRKGKEAFRAEALRRLRDLHGYITVEEAERLILKIE